MKQTHKIKRKLTLFFTVFLFLIVAIFGAIFFASKLYTSQHFDRQALRSFAQMTIRDQLTSADMQSAIRPYGKKPKREQEEKNHIDFIEIKNGKIIFYGIKNYIPERFLELSLQQNKREFRYGEYLFLKQKNFIFIKEMRYSYGDFGEDMLRLLILDLIFALGFFLIGRQFIAKIFRPVEENIDDMQHFVHNAGHELKTPIAVMDSNLQLMQLEKKYDSTLTAEMRTILLSMNQLIDGLITLSDISSLERTEKNNLPNIVADILEQYTKELQEKQIRVTNTIPENVQIEAHPAYLRIFLKNIIENAVKYNKNKGQIQLSFTKNTLTISDTGRGIIEKNKEKIFERFYRESEVRNSEGYGIGLALVKKIADIYNWDIAVTSEKGVGTSVKVRM